MLLNLASLFSDWYFTLQWFFLVMYSLSFTLSHIHSLSLSHPTAFTINFPCTRQKEGYVNFTLNFEFNSAAVDGLDALQGRGFSINGSIFCNCSVLQCNQQPTPGPEGESLFGNQIFYIVVGSVVGIIVLVIVVTFCYHCAMVRNWFLKRRGEDTEE